MHDFPPEAHEQVRRIAALMRDHRQRFYEEVSGWEAEASEQYSTEVDAFRHAVMSHLIETVQKRCRAKKGGDLSERWKPFSHVIAKKACAYRKLVTEHFPLTRIRPPTIELPTEVTDRPLTLREKIVVLAAIYATVVEKESGTEREDCYGALVREVSSQRGDEFWSQVALWVDDVEHVLHPSPPQEDVEALTTHDKSDKADEPTDVTEQATEQQQADVATKKQRLSAEEFNWHAGNYLKKHATDEHVVNIRELADHLATLNPAGTCSTHTVHGLPVYRQYYDRLLLTGRRGKKKNPKAVSLTPAVEATVGQEDKEMQRLIDDRTDDYEPSPLDDDPPDDPPVKSQPKIRRQV